MFFSAHAQSFRAVVPRMSTRCRGRQADDIENRGHFVSYLLCVCRQQCCQQTDSLFAWHPTPKKQLVCSTLSKTPLIATPKKQSCLFVAGSVVSFTSFAVLTSLPDVPFCWSFLYCDGQRGRERKSARALERNSRQTRNREKERNREKNR